MNCSLAHDLLQQSLDGVAIESLEWLAHLRECADCRSLALASRRLQEGLRLLPAPQPPDNLALRIVEAVQLERRRERRRGRRRWAVALALAASLLLALTLRFDWRGRSPEADKPSEPVAKSSGQTSGTPMPPKEADTPTLSESAAELKEVFAALTSQTADETVGQTRLLVSNVSSPALPPVDLSAVEPPTEPFRTAGEGVSEGLEPVTTSARRAMGLFLRELPPMEARAN